MTPARCGVIGHPVGHSRSPEIHRAFAEQSDIALEYELIDAAPDAFAARVRKFFAGAGKGLNVTVPHKAAAFELADEADGDARRSGAANTLTRLANGRIRADNTDGTGLVHDLIQNRGFPLTDRRILVVGAGGAAAGIIPALLDAAPSELALCNRTPARAETLARHLDDRRLNLLQSRAPDDIRSYDLVINATSASLRDERPDLPSTTIGSETLAYDLVYSGRPTPFMKWASDLGANSADGWGMLVEQAAESFCLWHGIRPHTGSVQRRTWPEIVGTH